ncbi:unnamed protein product [Phyllotreta striolata]|uniref:Odorant receptor n=1 Tax=Phyllotreta striolata TaxID=444603 RepID=A0A9N9XIM3_PHYSR|nr:unnamed protein product [Phyllotreta striolata]
MTRRNAETEECSYEFLRTDDCSKKTLLLPECILRFIFMWPRSDVKKQKVFYLFSMILFIFTQWGLVRFLIVNFDDYTKSLNVVSSMSTIFQASLKMSVLLYHSRSLSLILNDISHRFWPYDLLPNCTDRLRNSYRTKLVAMCTLSFTGLLFSLGSIVMPLLSHNAKELPYKCLYDFDTSVTPLYQIMYITESVLNAYIINCTVLGFDFLFMGVGENLINQYIMLRLTIENFGTKWVTNFNNKIRKLGLAEHLEGEDNTVFLKNYISHHQIIIRSTKIVENIFNLIAALQLCSSVVAICVSAFIATRENVGTAQIATMGSYLIGHLIQLNFYCAVGNDLLYESNSLTNHMFASNWYRIKNISLQKDFIFVIKNAQVPAKITAFKVFTLDYSTYIKVLRLSFSFYTLLSSLVEVKN